MLKRSFDLIFSSFVLVIAAPVLGWALWRVWSYDHHNPIYHAPRVGRKGQDFSMSKIRSMQIGADKSGLASTASSDGRITPVGHLIRRWKLDELSQFWNVLKGEMSVVGPRPQIRSGGVDRYTNEELRLLEVRPGITDISSIVFSDEGEILAQYDDPDMAYETLIRPWKSRFGLFYIDNRTFQMDIWIVGVTLLAIFSRSRALAELERLLVKFGASLELRTIARREVPLVVAAPPGAQSMA